MADTLPYAPHDAEDFSIAGDTYNLSRALHPNICIATVAFKGAAFFMYLEIKIGIFSLAFLFQEC